MVQGEGSRGDQARHKASREFESRKLVEGMGSHYVAREGDFEDSGFEGLVLQKQASRRSS